PGVARAARAHRAPVPEPVPEDGRGRPRHGDRRRLPQGGTMSLRARRLAGLGAIALLVGVVTLAIVRPSNPLAERHTYYAVFDTVHGLGAIDRDVRVAGVKVGKVGKVERR